MVQVAEILPNDSQVISFSIAITNYPGMFYLYKMCIENINLNLGCHCIETYNININKLIASQLNGVPNS